MINTKFIDAITNGERASSNIAAWDNDKSLNYERPTSQPVITQKPTSRVSGEVFELAESWRTVVRTAFNIPYDNDEMDNIFVRHPPDQTPSPIPRSQPSNTAASRKQQLHQEVPLEPTEATNSSSLLRIFLTVFLAESLPKSSTRITTLLSTRARPSFSSLFHKYHILAGAIEPKSTNPSDGHRSSRFHYPTQHSYQTMARRLFPPGLPRSLFPSSPRHI
ncbi:MAG: hypothetical protein Q9228_006626 [Teloschistes exilis]